MLLAVPQSWIPYVQTGLIIVLYISSLFSNDSCEFRPGHQTVHFREFHTKLLSFSEDMLMPSESSVYVGRTI